MKISFNPGEVKARFDHYRSETAISVERCNGGALVTLFGRDQLSAAFEVDSYSDFEQLKMMLPKKRSAYEKVNRGFNDDYFVLSIDREVLGEPFEECIEFTISLADPKTPWNEQSLRANLSFKDMPSFLLEIQKHLN